MNKIQSIIKLKIKLKDLIKSNYITYKFAIVIKLLLTLKIKTFLNELKLFLKSYKGIFIKKHNQKIIYDLYLQAIKICVQKNVNRWWYYTDTTSLQSLPSLYQFLKECVLRRAGDYESTYKILDELKKNGFQETKENQIIH